jgi:excisionase family DNA binding protein
MRARGAEQSFQPLTSSIWPLAFTCMPDQPKEKRSEFLTARQLADVLQVSESTIHRLRRAGRIPAILLTGRLIRFNLRDVKTALRPHAERAHREDAESEGDSEPSPQMAFEDVFEEF